MDTIHTLIQAILHIDQHLFAFVSAYGAWTYALLFVIIFCETGLVVTPMLPGDSLLFAAGAIAANTSNHFNIHILFILLMLASILGNTTNYLIAKYIGPRLFRTNTSRFLKAKYLDQAHAFYDKFGGKAIILARFIPIVRTFAPFVAGLARMPFQRFMLFNIVGATLWVGGLLYTSYLFGNLPFIKLHFSGLVLAIIVISLLPAFYEISRQLLSRHCCRAP